MFRYFSTTRSVVKPISKLFVLVGIFMFIGCDSDEEPELVCDSYFLKEERSLGTTMKYFYNDDGLLAVLEADDGDDVWRTRLKYNDDDQLIEALYAPGYKTDFFYEDGLLRSTINTDANGSRGNELKFYYDEENKLVKRELYIPASEEVYSYYTLEYPEPGILEAQFYNKKSEGVYEKSNLFTYTMDTNPRPYPEEYYVLYLSMTNVVTAHNQLSLEISENDVVKSLSTTTYEYNKGNYPTMTSLGNTTYSYSCEPAREEL